MRSLFLHFTLPLLCCCWSALGAEAMLEARTHHLRSGAEPEWEEFARHTPAGRRLDVSFNAKSNPREATLLLFQDGVKLDWPVELNGRKIGTLFLMEAPLTHALRVPAGALKDGKNTLSILPPSANDDIFAGRIRLLDEPLAEALGHATLEAQVTESPGESALPCRITVLDSEGALAPLLALPGQQLAVRPGVAYTGTGRARLGLLPGKYTVLATRGFEYSLGEWKGEVASNETASARLQLRREVDTAGFSASDTHIHTWTHSRHGDATINERALTLAGEGIELPVATDHDFLADFAEAARRTETASRFTPVGGCEITTGKGHFNIFPVQPGSRVPDFRLNDWPALMQAMRATPGVEVIVLNHPRNIHSNFQPFAATNFNAVTGENRRGFEFAFDAIEVANSSALQSDISLAWKDWMALLNYGHRVTALGSSDGHDVSRYIIGQGRTYIACDDTRPEQIDIRAACRSLLQGRASVSLGLLPVITVNQKQGVGDLAGGLGSAIEVRVKALGPSWVAADHIELYCNGKVIREWRAGEKTEALSLGERAAVTWTIPNPGHDAYLVVVATGPGVTGQHWAISRPYQPSSKQWTPRVLGLTNPVWLDGDGDGKFTAPRAYAKALVERHGAKPGELMKALAKYDETVAAQAASLCHALGEDVRGEAWAAAAQTAPEQTRSGFGKFMETLR